MIARVGDSLVAVSEEEAGRVCADAQECEPNYLYSAHFGRSRPKAAPAAAAPAPAPESRPAPRATRTPIPVNPIQPLESADYSRGILQVQRAWEQSKGAREIVVAVIDSGVSLNHPDLVDNLWVNEREKNGAPGIDDDDNGYVDDVHGFDFVGRVPNGDDDHGHGTHVAGIIAAAHNGIGTVGVAPNVRIMSLKFLNENSEGSTFAAIEAINYAVANGAHIISNSWGGGGKSEFLNQAIQRAIARGVLVTAAAGNEGSDNDQFAVFPAGFANVISVASTNRDDVLSVFSNYGAQSVMIAAPGSQIFSTHLGDGYKVMSGTSMATPQVSGALALALSVNPKVSREKLTELLCSSADSFLRGRGVACGRLNLVELLAAVR
jgi:subtilisin family serine protease